MKQYPKIPYIKFLTREEIAAVSVKECGEKLIDIPITDKVIHRTGDGSKWHLSSRCVKKVF